MKRFKALLAALFMAGNAAYGQSSLEMLQKDLDQLRQEHDESASKNLEYFFNSLQTAESSPDAADKLYLAAGGAPPEPAKVITQYEHETPSEASARTALDQAALGGFDGTLQLHCGMMRFAALFITQPKLDTLPDEWLAWLKNAAQLYPQIVVGISDSRGTPAADGNAPDRPRDHRNGDQPPVPKLDVGAPIRNLAMRDSPIGGYLGFHGWSDKEQGQWRVADLPRLYHDEVLEPLRKSPSAATLAAWDIYIAMMNADQPDAEKWSEVDYPALQFEKACDDFASAPGTDKLQALVDLIKAHPDHPQLDDWFDRVHDMIRDYQGQRAAGAAAAPASGPAAAALPPIQPDSPPPPAVVVPAGASTPAPAR